MKYPSDGIPYTLVIGKDGIVQNIYLGAKDADAQYEKYKGSERTKVLPSAVSTVKSGAKSPSDTSRRMICSSCSESEDASV